jgi:hypothetical protein
LLITIKEGFFRIVSIQIDNILFLANKEFAELEERELQIVQLTAKPRNKLLAKSNLIFHRYIVIIKLDNLIYLTQKDQYKKLQLINKKGENIQQDYFEQYTRSIYIASICQPEALYNLSIAV